MECLRKMDSNKESLIYRVYKKFAFRLFYYVFSTILKVNDKKISFLSDSNEVMRDNFEFVYSELKRRNIDLEYFIMLKGSVKDQKSYKEIFLLAYNLATSKIILLDDYYPMIYPLRIRKNAELIQLWHAVGAFKKFGYSRIGKPGGPLITAKDHKNYTRVIVSSKYVRPFYAEGFGIDIDKVVPTGIPRTDIFFDENYINKKREELLNKHPFLNDKKIILYAPTFRGNGQQSAYFPFDQLDLKKVYEALDEDTVFIIKMHHFVKEKVQIPIQYSNAIYDFTDLEKINDILFISDLLITDYSSVCFEFALLNKPMVFYCFDLEEYTHSRDFYTPFQEFAPGPICRNLDELLPIMNEYCQLRTMDQRKFTNKYFDHFDGRSTDRVVQLVETLLSNKYQ